MTPMACTDCGELFPEEDHRCPKTITKHDNNADFWLYGQCKACHRTVMIDYRTIIGGTFVCVWCHE